MTRSLCRKDRPIARRSGHRWEQVELRPYKEDERALFKTVSRQILFSDPELDAELRYFEVEPGGFSTLERHEHMHAVMVLRGRGECLVGREVRKIDLHDLITVPPWTWHQFRAGTKSRSASCAWSTRRRDKPQLPTEAEFGGASQGRGRRPLPFGQPETRCRRAEIGEPFVLRGAARRSPRQGFRTLVPSSNRNLFMDILTNPFRELLKGDHVPLGTWVMSGATSTAEALGSLGFDWILVDMEHTPIDVRDAYHILQALGGTQGRAHRAHRLERPDPGQAPDGCRARRA